MKTWLLCTCLPKQVARAIEKAFPCRKVGEAVIGLEVPHARVRFSSYSKGIGYAVSRIRN